MIVKMEHLRDKRRAGPRYLVGFMGVVMCSVLANVSVGASDIAPTLVPYEVVDELAIPSPLLKTPGNANRGRAVVADRKLGNCLACHQVSTMNDLPFHGDIAPTLDGLADRHTKGEIRLLVINPKIVFPDTLMPAFYRIDGLHRVAKEFQGKPILTAQQIEDVVAFLMTLKDEE
jgi:sulfur-oxidizing protein SoxX